MSAANGAAITVKLRQGSIVAEESLHLSSFIMTSIAPLTNFDYIWSIHPLNPVFHQRASAGFYLTGEIVMTELGGK